ncbi:unnamed protein product [Urochloa humidicola]
MGSLKAPDVSHRTSCPHESCWRATIMGIGKAVPLHEFQQKSFPDYYFDITSSNHMVDLKAKFAHICEKTMIEKRHFYMSNELLRDSPSIMAYSAPPSPDGRSSQMWVFPSLALRRHAKP